jgi:hypothetical protein
MQSYDTLIEKWSPVLNENSAGSITDHHRRAVTAVVLENQERALREQRSQERGFLTEDAPGNATSSIGTWDPVLISLVRRAMPNLIAYDVAGVQPMTGPTGLIFAMKARYGSGVSTAREALFNEAETRFSGDSAGTHDSDNVSGLEGIADGDGDGTIADSDISAQHNAAGMSTFKGEQLGSTGESPINKMGFTIEKQTVTAKTRALRADYSLELAQDLKAIHGLDAETELANILSTEILAEINREVIRTLNSQAKLGAVTANVAIDGIFNLSSDADGRWSAEKFKGLGVQIDREANAIAKATRRGKGNIVICSSDVATALAASGQLDYAPALATNLQVDDTGNTFAGVLNGRIKVYIDPYATGDYANVGYKGSNPYDAGVFYCPYVPLQMVRAVGENDFQPRIGFKTRYGMVANPYAPGAISNNGLGTIRANPYYSIFRVDNILT